MKLSDWISERGMTQEEFARRIGRSNSTVSRILNGKRRPDWATLEAVRDVTDGAVTPNDFADGMTGAATCAAPGE